jgi:hypothetical protein
MRAATYDAGALIAAERKSRAMWTYHRRLLDDKVRPTVSTAVLGQVWRGGPQPLLSRFLRGCKIEPLDERQARLAGAALARSGTNDVIDAVVVLSALPANKVIVTSDPDDLQRVADALGRELSLHVV